MFAKTGTTVDQTGLKAQVLAGYILTRSGRHLAFALFVNNVGSLKAFTDITHVFDDEASITDILYDRLQISRLSLKHCSVLRALA